MSYVDRDVRLLVNIPVAPLLLTIKCPGSDEPLGGFYFCLTATKGGDPTMNGMQPCSPPAGIHSTQTVQTVQPGNPIQVTLTPHTRK